MQANGMSNTDWVADLDVLQGPKVHTRAKEFGRNGLAGAMGANILGSEMMVLGSEDRCSGDGNSWQRSSSRTDVGALLTPVSVSLKQL